MVLATSISCEIAREQKPSNTSGYPIKVTNIRNIQLQDDFWLPIITTVQKRTIEYALKKCEDEGRMDNFLIAGGAMEGETRGAMPFDDTDVYKIIEGASYSLISNPNPQLETYLDSLVNIVKTGQEDDGYLTTWRTIDGQKPPAKWVNPGDRWDHLAASHELYNSGHMFEAAVAHYEATGKRNFLEIALRNADLLVKTFGPGKIELLPGHQIVETGLIQLYEVSGNDQYLNLSRYFLDQRGDSTTHELFGSYSQDHLPVVKQDEVVGHAVRAVYMYAGMTDIAAIQNDSAYRNAVYKLWNNMVDKKIYITGGIGALHEGESFGENYELPNLTAYSETCAAIGSVHWNHRLFRLTGDVKYYDVIERTLYNGLISGLSLDGEKFFYPNALESDGEYKFNQGACTRKSWFDCSCCPTNLIRFLPSFPGLIYANQADTIYVNLYASNKAKIDLNDQIVEISQITDYPWNGNVSLQIGPGQSTTFTLKLRVPGWASNEVLPGDLYSYLNKNRQKVKLTLNEKPIEIQPVKGYVTITRSWLAGDVLNMELPMNVKMTIANEKVEENKGKSSLEYGPLVYCVEEIDNPDGLDKTPLSDQISWNVKYHDNLLDGINVISGFNRKTNSDLTAIPYYAWSNRGVGAMKVWIPYLK